MAASREAADVALPAAVRPPFRAGHRDHIS
jgi:hypothetical protein